MYDEIRRLLPPGTGHDATEKKLDSLRESLDELAEDQVLADPRQSSVKETELQLASEPKRSASPGRSASRESAHNAPEPERSVALEPSSSPLAEVSENADGPIPDDSVLQPTPVEDGEQDGCDPTQVDLPLRPLTPSIASLTTSVVQRSRKRRLSQASDFSE